MLYGSDPTPVKAIDYLKKRLSEAQFPQSSLRVPIEAGRGNLLAELSTANY